MEGGEKMKTQFEYTEEYLKAIRLFKQTVIHDHTSILDVRAAFDQVLRKGMVLRVLFGIDFAILLKLFDEEEVE
jgi:hypothetical protein